MKSRCMSERVCMCVRNRTRGRSTDVKPEQLPTELIKTLVA
jgi:hypothetical protein